MGQPGKQMKNFSEKLKNINKTKRKKTSKLSGCVMKVKYGCRNNKIWMCYELKNVKESDSQWKTQKKNKIKKHLQKNVFIC